MIKIVKTDYPCTGDPNGVYQRILRKAKVRDCERGRMTVIVKIVKPVKKKKK